jgi:epoxyqueuosine reductase
LEIDKKIKEYCLSLGLDTIGFTKCRNFNELIPYYKKRFQDNKFNEFEEKEIKKKINPYEYMLSGKTIISIAFPYLFEKLTNTSTIYFSKYTNGNDYHKVISKYLEKICEYLESFGGNAKYFVDSNSLPERYIANLCGIGFIGKNKMLITKKYGSFVFLGEIITDLEIKINTPKESECGACNICTKTCPTNTLSSEDFNKCLSYLTQKKQLSDCELLKLNGRLFGCDTCQDACPYNKNVNFSKLEEFRTYDFMKNIDINELVNLNKNNFNSKYKLTSCGWRGKNILQRNAIINKYIFNKGTIDSININSDYIKDYYDRLLNKIKL